MHTLVLGPDYLPLSYHPLSAIHWQQGLRLFFLNKAAIVSYYDDWAIHSAKLTMRVPAVIVTKTGYSKKRHKVPLSRDNIFLRDLYRCGYCGETFHHKDLTQDHVVPRSHGGPHKWENLITSCRPCNHRKGSKLWAPLWTPKRPDYYAIANSVKQTITKIPHDSWYDYIGIERPSVAA
jgi:5-methylcytosine-specific restriction endonuclease McrA